MLFLGQRFRLIEIVPCEKNIKFQSYYDKILFINRVLFEEYLFWKLVLNCIAVLSYPLFENFI